MDRFGLGNRHGGRETFFVVVGVDEPAGDAVGVVAADFAGVGVQRRRRL